MSMNRSCVLDKICFQQLRNSTVFENFTEEEFNELSANSIERVYKKGQILFTDGEPRNKIFYLLDGFVRLEMYDETATFDYLDYVKKDTLFPYGGMFNDETYHYLAQAVTDIKIIYFPKKIFESNVLQNTGQLTFMYKKLSKILSEHESRIQSCIASSATDRVLNSLVYLKDTLGVKKENGDIFIPYPLTLTEIAVNSGATRETVGQAIKEFNSEGVLSYYHKIFTFFKR